MSPQEMLEHLETTVKYGMGRPEAEKYYTPDEHLEKYQDSLYNHRKMPKISGAIPSTGRKLTGIET